MQTVRILPQERVGQGIATQLLVVNLAHTTARPGVGFRLPQPVGTPECGFSPGPGTEGLGRLHGCTISGGSTSVIFPPRETRDNG